MNRPGSTESASTGLYDSPDAVSVQRGALRSGEVPIGVYGLGKIGRPVAAAFADLTGNVVGIDTDPTVVEAIQQGEGGFEHEPGLESVLASCVETGSLSATTDGSRAADYASVHVVVVPVGLTDSETADLEVLSAATETVAAGLSPGDLVVVETTVPPGTCRDIVTPILEEHSGLDRGQFGVAHCPERTSSGRALADVRGTYPRVVGGIDEESTRVAALVYDELVDNDIERVADAETAEVVKIAEGLYRDANIALANELAKQTDEIDVDVREVIRAANTQPYCDIHTPGVGVGGHCIPYYPHFLTSAVPNPMPLVETARETNDSMPRFTVEKTVDRLAAHGPGVEGATVAVFGLAYRPGIPETAASPAQGVIRGLAERGADVVAVDPVVGGSELFGAPIVPLSDVDGLDVDGVVVVTAHEEFQNFDWERFEDVVIVDGRDVVDRPVHPTYTIGRGDR